MRRDNHLFFFFKPKDIFEPYINLSDKDIISLSQFIYFHLITCVEKYHCHVTFEKGDYGK